MVETCILFQASREAVCPTELPVHCVLSILGDNQFPEGTYLASVKCSGCMYVCMYVTMSPLAIRAVALNLR